LHFDKESPQDNGGMSRKEVRRPNGGFAESKTTEQYKAKRILSVNAEPGGLCAKMSFLTERQTQYRNGDLAIFGRGRISRYIDTPL